MAEPSNILLYVTDPEASARLYATLLDREPVEASPTFVLFALPSGLALSLWARSGVVPAPTQAGGGGEIGFRVHGAARVDALHDAWRAKGAEIVLAPTDLDFGRSFVAVDPDGHRLRVYARTEDQ
ncbi:MULTISPECIES: VOC family protein [unclassified Methylobacterium]|jgi:catechol 2,3-dioxygenase-like lactoylglutathione lyase family enzyme|uniref:VOC family protein n=1 Tax=unclassified Methylobacterium TaxID=2615210 RepID=UPI0011CBF007|nr:VOC family protein [Methylobacterium sp. WL64]TXN03954.1 drug:proton antiporter [Methylobacterium sp. WL64]